MAARFLTRAFPASRLQMSGNTAKHSTIAALAGLMVGLAGCSAPPVGSDPSLTTTQRDRLQREAARPAVQSNEADESTVVECDLAVAPDRFSAWFTEKGAAGFSVFLNGRSSLFPVPSLRVSPSVEAGAVRSDALTGSWQKPGDRRRVVFADGSSALEEITVAHLPDHFQYEVWNLTNDTGRYVTYALSDFRFSASDRGTHVRWDYSFRRKGLPDGLFISRFVHEDVRRFMQATLTAMQAQARADSGMK